MSTYKTVALSGASGTVGKEVLKALLNAGFTVTALTRSDSDASFPSGVEVAKVDYNDVKSLTMALKGHDAVISAVGYAGMQRQTILVDAAVAAGVKRIIPSEFGADPEAPRPRNLPVFGHKLQVERHIRAKIKGTETTYTLVCNNELLDWDLDHGFVADLEKRTMEVLDGGDWVFTATPIPMVACGVVGVLQHPNETANRVVRLHGASMTQNKLFGLLRSCTGANEWEVTHATSAAKERESYRLLQSDPSNMIAWAIPMLLCATFGAEWQNDFSKNNDNALLGLKELSDAELEGIVRVRA